MCDIEKTEENIQKTEECSSYDYELSYDTVMEGIKLFTNSSENELARKKEKTQKIIVGICSVAAVLTVLFIHNTLSFIALVLCLGYLGFIITAPETKRKKAAKTLSGKGGSYQVRIFKNRFAIAENEVANDFFFAETKFFEGANVLTGVNRGVLIILPKNCFGNDLGGVLEKIKLNAKSFKGLND